jgi:hypothetical protein
MSLAFAIFIASCAEEIVGKKIGKVRKPSLPPDEDRLDEIGAESFPASDPPPWPVTHPGAPGPSDETAGRAGRRRPAAKREGAGAKPAAD